MTAKLIWNHPVFSHADFSLYQDATVSPLSSGWSSSSVTVHIVDFCWESRTILSGLLQNIAPFLPSDYEQRCMWKEKGRRRTEWTSAACLSTVRSLSRCLFAAASPPVFLPASAFLLLNLSPENNAHVVVILPEHTCIMMWHLPLSKSRLKSSAYFLSFWNISHQNSLCHAKKKKSIKEIKKYWPSC